MHVKVRAVANRRNGPYLRTAMRRHIYLLILILILAAACDWGLGTDPDDLVLDDLSDPPRNHATVVLTEDLEDDIGRVTITAGTEYFFPLRTPPPLPELLFDAVIAGGAPLVRVILLDVTQAGEFSTLDGVGLRFGAPDGRVFDPKSSCRVNVTSALNTAGGGRLQGRFDCPMIDELGELELRVLVKFDHTPE